VLAYSPGWPQKGSEFLTSLEIQYTNIPLEELKALLLISEKTTEVKELSQLQENRQSHATITATGK
jgi:hypothetical protein